jgi:NitT/TauT family transport system substrate-binding protein
MESVHRIARHGRRAPLFIAAVAIFALAGCAGGSGTPTEPASDVDPHAPEVSEITVAGYQNAPTTPLAAAMNAGYGEEYGINVELQVAENAPAMLAQIISGDVPIGQVNGFFSVPAVIEGADVRVIGEVLRGKPGVQTVEVLPDSGIESVADLEGKKVAVVGLNSGHQGRIAAAMIDAGADPSKVDFVALGWAEMPAALEQGTADAVVTIGPFQLQARNELGSETILDLADGPFAEFPDSQWLVNGAWADANPNALAAFQCAVVIRGQQLVTDDQDVYEDTLREYGFSEEAIAADVKVIFPAANKPAQIIPDIMYELGWIDEPFDISTITVPLPDNC